MKGDAPEEALDGDRWIRDFWMPEVDAAFGTNTGGALGGGELMVDRIPSGPTRPNAARI